VLVLQWVLALVLMFVFVFVFVCVCVGVSVIRVGVGVVCVSFVSMCGDRLTGRCSPLQAERSHRRPP
jgi:hypothetical protein